VTEPILAPRNAALHIVIGLVLGLAGMAVLLAGRIELAIFFGAICIVAYLDLRRLLAPVGHQLTLALGGLGVAGLLWCGYTGRLRLMPFVAAGLVLVLLTSRVLLNEGGVHPPIGVTADAAATLGSFGVVGALGAHVLLIRSMPHIGFRALLMFGLAVFLNDAAAFAAGRIRGRNKLAPSISANKTWEGAAAGFVVSTAVGLISGIVANPPFDVASGLALGAGIGVLAPVGDLAFSAVKRSAGVKDSGTYLGPLGGALDVVDGLLFVAPAFYWALRTIAL
jgi:phosphatidate cytidylyltransferase